MIFPFAPGTGRRSQARAGQQGVSGATITSTQGNGSDAGTSVPTARRKGNLHETWCAVAGAGRVVCRVLVGDCRSSDPEHRGPGGGYAAAGVRAASTDRPPA